MADTDILVSEMTPASQINTTDLMIMTQPDAQAETGYSTKSGTVLQVANKMLKGTEYSTDLPDFTDKTPLGGLEELKADIKALLPVDTASGNPCTFSTDIADTLVSLKAAIVASSGNGTPDSPIPINGYTEANITRCGVNLFDDTCLGYYTDEITLPAGTYYFKGFISTTGIDQQNTRFYWLDDTNTWQIITTSGSYDNGAITWTGSEFGWESGTFYATVTLTKPETFRMSCSNTTANTRRVGIFLTNVDTFTPYNGTTFTVSFGQTVYGGVYDANRGKVTIKHELVDLGDLGYGRTTSYDNPIFYANLSATYKGFANSLCSSYHKITDGSASTFASNASNYDFGYNSNGYGQLFIRNDDYSDPDAFQTAMVGQKITLELATPIEIDVSELSVDTIVGVNNIVSDCGGDVEVQYRDSIQHYIDKKIAETQALIL